MRKYELMVIFDPEIDPSDSKKRDALLAKFLGEKKDTITEVSDLGKKELRYPIGKKEAGVYVLVQLESDSMKVADLERQTKLMPEVLRYLLTRGEA